MYRYDDARVTQNKYKVILGDAIYNQVCIHHNSRSDWMKKDEGAHIDMITVE